MTQVVQALLVGGADRGVRDQVPSPPPPPAAWAPECPAAPGARPPKRPAAARIPVFLPAIFITAHACTT